jgi:hypothetical protein
MRANQSVLRPIFVVGSGRSGTTWIGDTIASCAGCVSIFEPLHPQSAAEAPRWGTNTCLPGPYLRADGTYPEWQRFFDSLLAGRISNWWTRRDWMKVPKVVARWPLAQRVGSHLAKCHYRVCEMRARRYVVKEIRANLMLDWLAAYTSGRFVYVLRHPCAVIGSRLLHPEFGFQIDPSEVLCQSELMRDYLEPFRATISAAQGPVIRQAVLWCVENFVPLAQARSRDWLICCYEDFVADRDAAFGRVFRFLGIEPGSGTERAMGRIVSNPTHDPRAQRPWHAPLSAADGVKVLQVCEKFGLTLYGRHCLPLCSPNDLLDSRFTARHEAAVRGIGDSLAEVDVRPRLEV